jgi:hypothetical protein
MPNISKILVKGIEYDVEDETAREILDAHQVVIDSMPTFYLDGTTLTIVAPEND